jgi:hypothetical protein
LARPIIFYEDRPYALLRFQTRIRLNELGTAIPNEQGAADLTARSTDEMLSAFSASFADTHYIQAYLPAGPRRELCRRTLVDRLAATAGGVAGRGLPLVPQLVQFDEQVRSAAIDAIGCYKTQLQDLFGDAANVTAPWDAYTRLLCPTAAYAERYWKRGRL